MSLHHTLQHSCAPCVVWSLVAGGYEGAIMLTALHMSFNWTCSFILLL